MEIRWCRSTSINMFDSSAMIYNLNWRIHIMSHDAEEELLSHPRKNKTKKKLPIHKHTKNWHVNDKYEYINFLGKATNTKLKLTPLGNSWRRAVSCMCLWRHKRGLGKASWRANGGCADAIGWAGRHSTLCHIVGYPLETSKEQDKELCCEQPWHLLQSYFLQEIPRLLSVTLFNTGNDK